MTLNDLITNYLKSTTKHKYKKFEIPWRMVILSLLLLLSGVSYSIYYYSGFTTCKSSMELKEIQDTCVQTRKLDDLNYYMSWLGLQFFAPITSTEIKSDKYVTSSLECNGLFQPRVIGNSFGNRLIQFNSYSEDRGTVAMITMNIINNCSLNPVGSLIMEYKEDINDFVYNVSDCLNVYKILLLSATMIRIVNDSSYCEKLKSEKQLQLCEECFDIGILSKLLLMLSLISLIVKIWMLIVKEYTQFKNKEYDIDEIKTNPDLENFIGD